MSSGNPRGTEKSPRYHRTEPLALGGLGFLLTP